MAVLSAPFTANRAMAGCVTPPGGLVSWWRGEDSTADAADGNNGTIAGTGTVTYGPGVVGQAFVFDGTHRDRVNIGNPTNLRLEDFTLEAWVKRSSPTVTSFDVLGADGSISGDGACIFGYGRGGYIFALANNGRMILSRTDMDGIISAPLVTDTNWHHLAVTKSGVSAVFYVDGVPQATPAYVHPAPYTFDDGTCVCSAAASIGSRGDARGGTFFGMIDEPAVFNRALTAPEIQAIYNAGSAGKCALLSTPANLINVNFGAHLNPFSLSAIKVGLAATGVTTNDFWNFYSRDGNNAFDWLVNSALPNLKLADGTPTAAGLVVHNAPGCWSNGSSDPMYNSYIYPFDGGNVTVTVTNLPAGQYDVLAYAIDGNYEVVSGGVSQGVQHTLEPTPANPPVWTQGVQYARFTNVNVSAGQPLVLTVRPGIYGYAIISGMQIATSISTSNPPPPTCVPAPSGLVSWWRGESNAADSVDGNNGMLQSGVTFAGGKVGQAFTFDGTTGSVTVAASSSLNVGLGDGLSIETWIKPSTVALERPIVEWNSVTGGNPYPYGVHFWISVPVGYGAGPGCLYANIVDTAGRFHWLTSAGGLINTNSFQHVAMTYDKTSGLAVLYLNGAVAAQKNLGSFTPQTSYNLYLGRRPGGVAAAYSWAGLMDEVSLYSRALSQSEIQAIYNAASAGKCVVAVPPFITTQPTNKTVAVGANVTFIVAAGGTSPLSYQWSFNGTNITSATNSSLALVNVQFTNAGIYSVVVSNSAGSAPSSNAILTVIPPPVCVPSPSGLVSWWRGEDSTADAADGNNGTIAGTGTVTYGPGVVGQAFVFDGTHRDRVNIGNPTNLRLEDFTLEAWVKRSSPTVTSFDVLGADGSISGDGACIFGYGRGGYIFALANNGRMILSRTDMDGIISAPLVTDTNWHHLAVTKSGVSAVFYVDGVPQATPAYVHPAPYTFDDGTCVCSAAASIGSRGDARGGTFFGMIDEPAVFNRALTAPEIQAIYAADGTGKCQEPPVILTQPVSQKVTVGLNVTFSVIASGTPQLRYQWRFNGDNLAGATDSTVNFTVSDTSGGLYSVRVTNAFGSVISSNALLVVNHPPVADAGATLPLVISPNNTNATVVLDASRASDPDGDALQYRWLAAGAVDTFATGVVAVVTLPVGSNALMLTVTDGLAANSQAFAVEVITPAQAAERLVALVNSGAPRPQPLIATLSAAITAIDRSDPTAAINQLQAFQNKVRAQVSPLDPALAQTFIQAAQTIIDALNAGPGKARGRITHVSREADGKTRLKGEAVPGALYIIEASSNLVDWEKIGVAAHCGNGTFEFEDANAGRYLARYYRITSP